MVKKAPYKFVERGCFAAGYFFAGLPQGGPPASHCGTESPGL